MTKDDGTCRVFVFLAEGFEEIEALTVVDMLSRASVKVAMVSVTDKRTVTGSHGITVEADGLFAQFALEGRFDSGEMLVLPGGMPGTKNLMNHQELKQLILEYHEQKRYVTAICAAPTILAACGLLQGRHAVCYPDFEKELCGAKVMRDAVVQDGYLITSRGMGTAIPFAAALIRVLVSEEEAERILEKIIYTAGA